MKRLLVVDDDPDILESLTMLLEARYAVTPAEDGNVALELLGEQTFDAVVLDLMLPVLNGTRVLQELRQRGHTVPVILISAHQELDLQEERHRELGAFSSLRKPFNIQELEKQLEQAMGPSDGPGGPPDSVVPSRNDIWPPW
ncbi:response regulator [Archangium violaceum]|uniref:response regulator n=1 Tax=Archangium violaceum TaxID=83451 RepID=UPI002B2CD0A8|nr:response regulator [Archangium gephyra]